MRRIPLLGSVLMSLCLGACGGDVSPEPDALEGEVSQEVTAPYDPPACNTSRDWILRYYSSSSQTTSVGTLTCSCGVLYRTGQTSNYARVTYYAACVI